MTKFTIGEIFRLGLLKNTDGEAYKHKATVSKIVNSLHYVPVKTRWGMSKALTQKQIDAFNKSNIL